MFLSHLASTCLVLMPLVSLLTFAVSLSTGPTIFADFVLLNYSWDGKHTHDAYASDGKYIPENCLLAGIKLDITGDIFVTVPRWKSGVPATLARLSKGTGDDYTLSPYPSWDMQQEGVEGDLQNCQSMHIEQSRRRMWVIDVGVRNFFEGSTASVPGKPGLFFVDMESLSVVDKYYFPEDVVSSSESFLNDIVVDEFREIAFLTDAWGDGGLITFNYPLRESKRYSGASTKNEPDYVMIIDNVFYGKRIFTTPSDGVALSGDGKYVYYCAVQGTHLYRIPAAMLRDFSATNTEIDQSIECLGEKSPSDGIMFWGDVLYFGSLPESSFSAVEILSENTPPNVTGNAVSVPSDPVNMQWVDTFSLDPTDSTKLWFVSNELDKFVVGSMDFSGKSGANMRILWTEKIV